MILCLKISFKTFVIYKYCLLLNIKLSTFNCIYYLKLCLVALLKYGHGYNDLLNLLKSNNVKMYLWNKYTKLLLRNEKCFTLWERSNKQIWKIMSWS